MTRLLDTAQVRRALTDLKESGCVITEDSETAVATYQNNKVLTALRMGAAPRWIVRYFNSDVFLWKDPNE